jgi:glutamate synthase domain-containing protein 3
VNYELVKLDDLDDLDIEVLRRLVREHEEKTVSPRARNILVRWNEFLPLFRKVSPKGAELQAAAIRAAYLASPQLDSEMLLARRSA